MCDQVTAKERAEVYEALFAKEPGLRNTGYNGSGHEYRCVNGHVYFIGDCGGAMEESRCPECGAVIGGTGECLDNLLFSLSTKLFEGSYH